MVLLNENDRIAVEKGPGVWKLQDAFFGRFAQKPQRTVQFVTECKEERDGKLQPVILEVRIDGIEYGAFADKNGATWIITGTVVKTCAFRCEDDPVKDSFQVVIHYDSRGGVGSFQLK